MMKKTFALLLTLALLLPCSALVEDAPGPLTKQEVEAYLADFAALVAEMPDLEIADNGDGTAFVMFPGGSIIIEGTEMSADAHVLNASVDTYGLPVLRGIGVGSTLSEVLAAYPNDNDGLYGSMYEATLYISGEKPEVSLGYILRNGQRVEAVVHDSVYWGDNSASMCDVTYQLEDNRVCYMVVDSAFWEQDPEEMAGLVAESARIQEVNEYFAFRVSEDGASLPQLEREDLSIRPLGGEALDLIDLTAEAMTDAFGPAQVDEWTEDSTGEKLRTLQWNGLSLLLVYDAQKNFLRVDSLTVNDDVAEGPRGVRVGDLLDDVIFRFRHEEEYVDDSRMLLYGDGQDAPYGVLSYTPESAEVSYALSLDGFGNVVWHLTFTTGRLQSMSMLFR